MYSLTRPPRWKSVARNLSFSLEDTHAVNLHFVRWRRSRAERDRRAIDIWTYCYINRYFAAKTRSSTVWQSGERDQMIERAFLKVQRSLDDVECPQRFSHWVSVICKHTFINYVRQEIASVSLEEDRIRRTAAASHYRGRYYDAEVTYGALSEAIARLPRFLRQTARLRFLRHLSYERISDITGKPVATLRTYVHKTTRRFRKDPQLRSLRDELLRP